MAADPLPLGVGQPPANDPLARFAAPPQAVNATLGFEAVEQKHPFRKVEGREVDLRPLFSWINRGRVSRGQKPFTQECPAAEWFPINGTLVSVLDDAVLVSLPLSRKAVFVKNYPKDLNPAKGSDVAVVAVAAGTFNYETESGRKESVKVYDYGVPFTPAVLRGTNAPGNARSFTNLPAIQPKPAKRK